VEAPKASPMAIPITAAIPRDYFSVRLSSLAEYSFLSAISLKINENNFRSSSSAGIMLC